MAPASPVAVGAAPTRTRRNWSPPSRRAARQSNSPTSRAAAPRCAPGLVSGPEWAGGATIASALDLWLRFATFIARFHWVKAVYVSEFATPTNLIPEFAGHSLCEARVPFYRGFDALTPGQEGAEAVLHLNK